MDFYLDERQRKKHRRLLKLKIYAGVAGFLLLLIGGAYAVVYSPLFQIKNIAVTQTNTNTKQIDGDSLMQDLKNFFVSQSKVTEFLGINNILIWNNTKLVQFQKNSAIANLTIEKDYWHHQIKIIVSEREKFGIWCPSPFVDNTSTTEANFASQSTKGEGCYWFDKNGVLFNGAPSAEGNLINKVDDFSGRSLKIGDSILGEKLVSNLIKVFDVLEQADLGIKSLKLERPELQEILTESSPIIYFSLRNDPSFGLSAIESLKSTGLNKLEYIDLRVENRAYYK